ncbi:TIGR02270 family protein [Pseudomonas fulva]|uniref:TIGR02270 family protein n=1 Tax=Pseudomonas fulva TaxID=47880 RepID=UPI00201DD3D7|nr:TIGR02270 family protein [Pseudomonas fulva]UQY36670.1 TIGR02270 family protein [Pseudomonas fulva]
MITTILDQHAEEAAFLAGLRCYAVGAPHYDLAHLGDLDERIEAHLDGLQIAGLKGLHLLLEQLTPHAQGEVFATAALALRLSNESALETLYQHLHAKPEGEPFLVAALGWLEWHEVSALIERDLHANDAQRRRIALAALALHGKDPGPALLSALAHGDAGVLAAAARLAGTLRRRDLLQPLRQHRLHGDDEVRFWSNWASAQMGDQEALGNLRLFAEQPGERRRPALEVLLAWQPREASIAWLRGLMQSEAHRHMAIQAIGLLGDPQTVPWLIRQMHELPTARAAGEAFSLITGADLAELDLELDVYPDYDEGPTDDPSDANVAMDPDIDLPWPDPQHVEQWWQGQQQSLQPGIGYLLGQPFSERQCMAVLRSGTQRQRRAAASLLARYQPTSTLFATDAPARRQKRLLGC